MTDQTTGSHTEANVRGEPHAAAGVIHAQVRACPFCGRAHPETLFCPETGLAAQDARDSYCGTALADGVRLVQPLWRVGPDAFYAAQSTSGILLAKLFGVVDDAGRASDARRRLVLDRRLYDALSDLPFVPTVVTLDEGASPPYVLLDTTEGEPLTLALTRPLDGDAAVSLALQLLSAVRILHRRHVVLGGRIESRLFVTRETGTLLVVDLSGAQSFQSAPDGTITFPPMALQAAGNDTEGSQDTEPARDAAEQASQEKEEKQRDTTSCCLVVARILRSASFPEAVAGELTAVLSSCEKGAVSLSSLTQALEQLRGALEVSDLPAARPLAAVRPRAADEETAAVARPPKRRGWYILTGLGLVASAAVLAAVLGRRKEPGSDSRALRPTSRPAVPRSAPVKPNGGTVGRSKTGSGSRVERHVPRGQPPRQVRRVSGRTPSIPSSTKGSSRPRSGKAAGTPAETTRPVRPARPRARTRGGPSGRPAAKPPRGTVPRPRAPTDEDFRREADEAVDFP